MSRLSATSVALLALLVTALLLSRIGTNKSDSWAPDREHFSAATTDFAAAGPSADQRPLFIETRGIAGERVLFHTHGADHTVSVMPDRLVFRRTISEGRSEVLEQRFIGARSDVTVEGAESRATRVNYYLSPDPDSWRSDLPSFSGVQYRGLYDGIDFRLDGTKDGLKSEFVVSPGADPSLIRFEYLGGDAVDIGADGSLAIVTQFGQLTEKAPVSFQWIDGRKVIVSSEYRLDEHGVVTIALEAYDQTRELIIDPDIVYATFMSGTGSSTLVGVAPLPDGTVIVGGSAGSADFPTSVNPGGQVGGSFDAFIAKVDRTKNDYDWLTFIGGPRFDLARSIAADTNGNVYMAGTSTGEGFPLLNPVQGAYAGGSADAVVMAFGPDGALTASTYLGSSENDVSRKIGLGPGGEVIVSGFTDGTDFPEQNPLQDGNSGDDDLFVTVYDPDLNSILFSTQIGGIGGEVLWHMDVLTDGSIKMFGETASPDFPIVDPYQGSLNGPSDAYFMTLTNAVTPPGGPSGVPTITQSSFFGGETNDRIASAASDPTSGAFCFGGITNSSVITNTIGAPQPALGSIDVFAGCFDSEGGLTSFIRDGTDAPDFLDLILPLGDGQFVAGVEFAGQTGIRTYALDDPAEPTSEVNAIGDMIVGKGAIMPSQVITQTLAAFGGRAQDLPTTAGAIQGEPGTECPDGSPECRENAAFTIISFPTSPALPLLSIEKTASTLTTLTGKPISFTITVTNIGDIPAENVIVMDRTSSFSSNPPVLRQDRSGNTYRESGLDLRWDIPTLAPGTSQAFDVGAVVEFVGRNGINENVVSAEAANASKVRGTVQVSASFFDGEMVVKNFIWSDLGDDRPFGKSATGPYDVYFAESLWATGLDSAGSVSDSVEVALLTPLVTVTRSGVDPATEVLGASAIDLLYEDEDEQWVASEVSQVLFGFTGPDSVTVLHVPGLRTEASLPDHVDVVLGNATPFALSVTGIGKNSAALAFDTLAPGSVSAYATVPAGPVNFTSRAAEKGQFTEVTFDFADLAGQAVTLTAFGDQGGGSFVGVGPDGNEIQPAGEVVDAEQEQLPTATSLTAIYPNPFTTQTTLAFDLEQPSLVEIAVFDMGGRQVTTLADREYAAGSHRAVWNVASADGSVLSSGTYFVRMKTGDVEQTRSVVLIR